MGAHFNLCWPTDSKEVVYHRYLRTCTWVNSFQDAGTMNKERNVWIALNQATIEDLEAFPHAFPSYLSQKERLNRKFGMYKFLGEVEEPRIMYELLDRCVQGGENHVDSLLVRGG